MEAFLEAVRDSEAYVAVMKFIGFGMHIHHL